MDRLLWEEKRGDYTFGVYEPSGLPEPLGLGALPKDFQSRLLEAAIFPDTERADAAIKAVEIALYKFQGAQWAQKEKNFRDKTTREAIETLSKCLSEMAEIDPFFRFDVFSHPDLEKFSFQFASSDDFKRASLTLTRIAEDSKLPRGRPQYSAEADHCARSLYKAWTQNATRPDKPRVALRSFRFFLKLTLENIRYPVGAYEWHPPMEKRFLTSKLDQIEIDALLHYSNIIANNLLKYL